MIIILSIIAGLTLLSLATCFLTAVYDWMHSPVTIRYTPLQVKLFIVEVIVVAALLIWTICFP